MSNFEHHIQINTDFKRTNQSIVTLIGLASRKMINLEPDTSMEQVQNIIKEHYKQSSGKIDFWGNVLSYSWIHSESKSTRINVDGWLVVE